MQGRSGPVNRVELESQVLCAALRQSCHLLDKMGAFTSVRELSHLFPDLLPPPEKQDAGAESNRSNYYSVLGIRPQAASHGVMSAYLRAVRQFLRTNNATKARAEFSDILTAGLVLRKPRLRLSHDLVVTRRWLYEASRRAAAGHVEVTLDQPIPVVELQAAKAQARESTEPTSTRVPPPPPVPEVPKSVPPAPPLPVPSASPVAKEGATPAAAGVDVALSSTQEIPSMAQIMADARETHAAHTATEEPAPIAPAPKEPPAKVEVPEDKPVAAAEPAAEDANFVFDESQFQLPPSPSGEQLPLLIRMMEAAQLISAVEIQALMAQMNFAPDIPVERHILNAGYLNQQELASVKLGESLVQQGKITVAQFQVAIYDERVSGLRMAESLQVRGWLSVEVRNAIDDWHRKRQ